MTYASANNTLRFNFNFNFSCSDSTATGECDRKVEIQFNAMPAQVLDLH